VAGKSGGAWKVAYADFVTAMMAFFLVMWICGQDQKIKRAVSYYFTDPFSASLVGTSKKPNRTGSISEVITTGSVPQLESVALGRGRHAYSQNADSSPTTKFVSDFFHADDETTEYWRDQARRQRELAAKSKDVGGNPELIDKLAVQQLSKRLKEEITRGIPAGATGLYQDLLFEAINEVNWNEIAEDLLAQ
jgi:flagellar motor protein MotB